MEDSQLLEKFLAAIERLADGIEEQNRIAREDILLINELDVEQSGRPN